MHLLGLTFNGEEHNTTAGMTLHGLSFPLGVRQGSVVVERNGPLVE